MQRGSCGCYFGRMERGSSFFVGGCWGWEFDIGSAKKVCVVFEDLSFSMIRYFDVV